MALSSTQKQDLIDTYQEGLAKAPNAFLLGFSGITVPQVTELRSKVRESGGQYQVVKNTLALRATEGTAMAELREHFVGETAVAYTDGDVVALAKTLTDFAKDVKALQFKAGLVDSQAVAADQIQEIASMPSREELIAKLLFLLQSPMTRLTRGLNAITRDFVVVLGQVAEKKEA